MPVFFKPSRRERGAGRFMFLLLLALVAAIIYLAVTFIPAYLGNRSLEEAAAEIVRRGAQLNLTDTDVKAQLAEKAREFGPPGKHDIDLWHEGKGLAARIRYTHEVKFPFYTYPWPVEIQVKDVGF